MGFEISVSIRLGWVLRQLDWEGQVGRLGVGGIEVEVELNGCGVLVCWCLVGVCLRFWVGCECLGVCCLVATGNELR